MTKHNQQEVEKIASTFGSKIDEALSYLWSEGVNVSQRTYMRLKNREISLSDEYHAMLNNLTKG